LKVFEILNIIFTFISSVKILNLHKDKYLWELILFVLKAMVANSKKQPLSSRVEIERKSKEWSYSDYLSIPNIAGSVFQMNIQLGFLPDKGLSVQPMNKIGFSSIEHRIF
jgi:hypothetical protein